MSHVHIVDPALNPAEQGGGGGRGGGVWHRNSAWAEQVKFSLLEIQKFNKETQALGFAAAELSKWQFLEVHKNALLLGFLILLLLKFHWSTFPDPPYQKQYYLFIYLSWL